MENPQIYKSKVDCKPFLELQNIGGVKTQGTLRAPKN